MQRQTPTSGPTPSNWHRAITKPGWILWQRTGPSAGKKPGGCSLGKPQRNARARNASSDPNEVIEIQAQTLTVSELWRRGREFDQVALPDPIEGSLAMG